MRKTVAIAVLILASSAPAGAQDIEALMAELRELRARTEALEARLEPAQAKRSTVTGAGPIIAGDGPTGSMPVNLAESGLVVHSNRTSLNVLAATFGVAQHRGIPDGGPQALEGYVFVDPPAGETIRLAMSLIGNGEHRGAGDVVEMRSPGGVVSGPGTVRTWFMHRPVIDVIGEGSIDVAVAYSAEFPRRNVREKWGVRFDDPTVRHRLAGDTRVGSLTFENNWQLRAGSDAIELVRPDGSVAHVFR